MFCPRPHRLIVAACLTVGAFAVVTQSAQADVADSEITVLNLVNRERAALGRAALGTDVRLFNAAEAHTEWMCANQTLSHIGAGGSSPGGRASVAGYTWNAIGETIGQGYPTAQDIVLGWKGSSPHWTILMSATYRDAGIAYVACSGQSRRHYWTVGVANSTRAATPVTAPTAGPTATRTPTRTPTRTSTATATSAGPTAPILVVTATPSATPTPTRTPTRAATLAGPATATPTRTRTATQPPAASATPSRTPTRTSTAAPPAPAAPTVAGPTAGSSSGGADLVGRVLLQGRQQFGGTTIYVNSAPLAVTASDGTFEIEGLAPGYKTVRAQRYGFLAAAVQASLGAGEKTVLGATTLLSGDVHIDQRVTSLDQLVVQLRYGACFGAPAYAPHIDLDDSGCIDTADVALVTLNIGRLGPTAWR